MTTMHLPWHHRERGDLDQAREAVATAKVQQAQAEARWPKIRAVTERARRVNAELAAERARNHFGQMALDALGERTEDR